MGGYESNGQCREFDGEKYRVIPSLNVNRRSAASTYIENKVVISGGFKDFCNYFDSIEVLDWDETNHGSQWIKFPSKLPIKISNHTMVTCNNKLYVIGGYHENIYGSDSSDSSVLGSESCNIFGLPEEAHTNSISSCYSSWSNRAFAQKLYNYHPVGSEGKPPGACGRSLFITSNKIWEGVFDSQNNKISWVEMGFRLQKKRHNHFSFVISNEIIIFGGCDAEHQISCDIVEIIQGNRITKGPSVPFPLNSVDDHAILDRKNRIIIISKNHGMIVYNHKNGTFTNYDHLKLRVKGGIHAAILQ